MITKEEALKNLGNKVIYRAPHVDSHSPGEEGVITSVNELWAFVRYGSDTHSKATPYSDLELVKQ